MPNQSIVQSTPIVDGLPQRGPSDQDSTRFDGYTATTSSLTAEDVLPWLAASEGAKIIPGRGFHTFGKRISVKDEAGDEIGAVSYGGRHKELIMIEIKGARTDEIVKRLRQTASHRCTRVDVCIDFDQKGIFDELHAILMKTKQNFRLIGERLGDWDYSEQGRTQYLGLRIVLCVQDCTKKESIPNCST